MTSNRKTRARKPSAGVITSKQIGRHIPVSASALAQASAAVRRAQHKISSNYTLSTAVGISNTRRNALVEKLKHKAYRDEYVRSTVVNGIAHQIRVNRENRKLSQADLAKICGGKTTQVSISRLEDPAYGKFTFSSLLKVASALDVALLVKLVPYSKFILETADKTPSGLYTKPFSDENLYIGQAMFTVTEGLGEQKTKPYLAPQPALISSEQALLISPAQISNHSANTGSTQLTKAFNLGAEYESRGH